MTRPTPQQVIERARERLTLLSALPTASSPGEAFRALQRERQAALDLAEAAQHFFDTGDMVALGEALARYLETLNPGGEHE